jgi:DNA polymerase V
VWGIGRKYAAKLTDAGINSAADLARVSKARVRKHLGSVVGARWFKNCKAYSAQVCTPQKMEHLADKAISCSCTFGRPMTGYTDVLAAATFLSRAAEKLRAQGDTAHVLTVYVSRNRFAPHVLPSTSAQLPSPCQATQLPIRLYC